MDGRLGEKTANGRAKWWDEMWSFKPASRGGGGAELAQQH
jgi:hypothetical protein